MPQGIDILAGICILGGIASTPRAAPAQHGGPDRDAARDHRPDQDLPQGRPGQRRDRPLGRGRRGLRPARPQRRRQDDARQPGRRAPPPRRRDDHDRRPRRRRRPGLRPPRLLDPAAGPGPDRRADAAPGDRARRAHPRRPPRATSASASAHLAEALDIGEWLDQDGRKLSGGVKRLVSFAMAAVVPGRLVVFDEPTNDVDPVRRRLLWAQVRAVGDEGAAVLLVTHNVVEAERSVDRLAILDHGRVIETGTPAELKERVADDLRLELVLEPGVERAAAARLRAALGGAGQRIVATVHASAAAAGGGLGRRPQALRGRRGVPPRAGHARGRLRRAGRAAPMRSPGRQRRRRVTPATTGRPPAPPERPTRRRPSMTALRSYLLLVRWKALRSEELPALRDRHPGALLARDRDRAPAPLPADRRRRRSCTSPPARPPSR